MLSAEKFILFLIDVNIKRCDLPKVGRENRNKHFVPVRFESNSVFHYLFSVNRIFYIH